MQIEAWKVQMRAGNRKQLLNSRFAGVALLPACLILPLFSLVAHAQEPRAPKRVLVLYWYGKDFPANVLLDKGVQTVLRSNAEGAVEYFPEYLESNPFRGENQSLALRDYLRRKYADLRIDVIISMSHSSLEFLLKYHKDLFPKTPIVYYTNKPIDRDDSIDASLSRVVVDKVYRKTLDMALRLHPRTEQVFIISGTPQREKRVEAEVRADLKGLEGQVGLTYLTDLPLAELVSRVKALPERSIILYVRHSQDEPGKTLNPSDILALVAQSANVPVYGIASYYLGYGAVGAYAINVEDCGIKTAEVALRIANGVRPERIPVQIAESVPMFDWRQLQRWRIDEKKLPAGSIVRFKEPTFWEHYKWRIAGVFSLCIIEAGLIALLLLERRRRQRATRALGLSEEQYRAFFELTAVGAGQASAQDGRFLRVNEVHCTLTGYSREELLGMRFADITHPEDREKDLDKFRRLVSGEITRYSNEKRYIRKDGQIVWVHVHLSMVRDVAGRPLHTVAIVQDITQRKQGEASLRASEERYRNVVEAQTELICRYLPDSTLTFVNDAYCRYFGMTREQLIGSKFVQLIPEPEREAASAYIESLIGDPRVEMHEHRVVKSDGRMGWQQWINHVVRDANGRVVELQGIGRDISERKQAEQELQQLSVRFLGLQDEERRRIARELHDVTAQNLFAATIGLARAERGVLPPELRETLTECQTLCEQSLKEIRTLSYLLHPPMLDHAGLVPALQWYIEGFTKRSGIEVSLLAPEEIGPLSKEVERDLFRIVQEALTNVHRHSGSLIAQVLLERRNQHLVLQIKDQGRVLRQKPAEVNASGIELLGVGIRGMQERLRQLSGRLEIESNDQGTTVTAVVPLPGELAFRLHAGQGR